MIFQLFPQNYAFLSIPWSKFLLKNTLKITAKSVLLHSKAWRVPPLAPSPPPFATPLGGARVPCAEFEEK